MMDVFWCSVKRRHGTLGQGVPPIDVFTECLRFWSAAGVLLASRKLPGARLWRRFTASFPFNVYAHFGLIGAVLTMSTKSGGAQLTSEQLPLEKSLRYPG